MNDKMQHNGKKVSKVCGQGRNLREKGRKGKSSEGNYQDGNDCGSSV